MRSLDRTLSGDTLNNTLALNPNSSKTFANFKAELQEAGIPTDLSNSFLSFLEKNIYKGLECRCSGFEKIPINRRELGVAGG